VGKYLKGFHRMAVERLKTCDNIVELSQELGVHRRLLYKWRDQFDPFGSGEEAPPGNSRESALRKEINQLKRVVLDKTLASHTALIGRRTFRNLCNDLPRYTCVLFHDKVRTV
jgi:transposase-like protein